MSRAILCCALWAAAATCVPNRRAAAQGPTTIRAVEFVGARSVPEEVLRAATHSRPGEAYEAQMVSGDVARIERAYAERGYTLARVSEADLLPDGTLRFTILEGVVDGVRITGNRRTRAAVIRETVETAPGATYNEKKARADRARLYDLGVFDEVMVEPVPADTAGRVRLHVKVRERRTGYVAGAVAYGSNAGIIGYLDAGDSNFLGNAQMLRLQWQRGVAVGSSAYEDRVARRTAVELSFDDPHVVRKRLSLGLDLYHNETPFTPVFTALDLSPRQFELREGATVRVGTAFSSHSTAYVHLRHDRVNFDDLPAGLLPPSDLVGSRGTVASVALVGVLNHRDRDADPRRGHHEAVTAEFGTPALGGTFNYRKITADLRGYVPAGRGTFALRAVAGAATTSTPLSEQYWMGGYEALRGYDYDEFHGTRMALLSGEYRWPVMPAIELAVFSDAGCAWARGQAVELADLKAGGGLGVRFLTPIGAIRFDVAGGRGVHTYLSLGQVF